MERKDFLVAKEWDYPQDIYECGQLVYDCLMAIASGGSRKGMLLKKSFVSSLSLRDFIKNRVTDVELSILGIDDVEEASLTLAKLALAGVKQGNVSIRSDGGFWVASEMVQVGFIIDEILEWLRKQGREVEIKYKTVKAEGELG